MSAFVKLELERVVVADADFVVAAHVGSNPSFCCTTTTAMCQALKRQWSGIDTDVEADCDAESNAYSDAETLHMGDTDSSADNGDAGTKVEGGAGPTGTTVALAGTTSSNVNMDTPAVVDANGAIAQTPPGSATMQAPGAAEAGATADASAAAQDLDFPDDVPLAQGVPETALQQCRRALILVCATKA